MASVTLRPLSDVSYGANGPLENYPAGTTWGSHHNLIDDTGSSDYDSTRVMTPIQNTSDFYEIYGFDGIPAGSTDVWIRFYARFRATSLISSGTLPSISFMVRIDDTDYEDVPYFFSATSYQLYSSFSDPFETENPATSSAWTAADINGVNGFGFRVNGGYCQTYDPKLGYQYYWPQVFVTQFYVVVDYAPPVDFPYAIAGGSGVVDGFKVALIG